MISTDPNYLPWFTDTFYQHIVEKVDVEDRVETTEWLEAIPTLTYEQFQSCGKTCPHAKELDFAISKYVTESIKGPTKSSLEDKSKGLLREQDILKRWMPG